MKRRRFLAAVGAALAVLPGCRFLAARKKTCSRCGKRPVVGKGRDGKLCSRCFFDAVHLELDPKGWLRFGIVEGYGDRAVHIATNPRRMIRLHMDSRVELEQQIALYDAVGDDFVARLPVGPNLQSPKLIPYLHPEYDFLVLSHWLWEQPIEVDTRT